MVFFVDFEFCSNTLLSLDFTSDFHFVFDFQIRTFYYYSSFNVH